LPVSCVDEHPSSVLFIVREGRGERKAHLLVDTGEGVELVLEVGGVLLVEEAVQERKVSTSKKGGKREENVHLDGLGAVNGLAGALAGDLLHVVYEKITRVWRYTV
jgi:hypothetical protein